MLSRPHPSHGWLHLQPADWRATLQRQVEERDRLDDINHSGPAPAFLAWVDEVQMPALARRPEYAKQFADRVAELEMLLANLEHSISQGRLDLEPAAGIHRREIKQLTALVEEPHG
jgi:hypothetical protein